MATRQKNPLYVVKGDQVQRAENWFDMLIKKFNLEPLVELLMNLMKLMLEQVNSYPVFKAVKEFIDLVVGRILLFKNFAII